MGLHADGCLAFVRTHFCQARAVADVCLHGGRLVVRRAGWQSGVVRVRGVLAAAAAAGVGGYRMLVGGQLTVDTGWGRSVRPLGPFGVSIGAPREVVFDVIAAPYLGRTPRAMADKLDVLERGSDMVLAEHRTPVGGGLVASRWRPSGSTGRTGWSSGSCAARFRTSWSTSC